MALTLEKVLISDAVDASCCGILKTHGVNVEYRPGLSKDDLLAIIKDYDGLIVRSATKVTADVIAAGKRLRLIGRAGTGVDNIDLKAATAAGILVLNTPTGNMISAAEHTCAMMCALARNIPQGYASMKAGKWDRKKFMGIELCGRTLGIVGLGRIGKEVAIRMQSFGMRTVGYDPIVPAAAAAEFNVEFMELEEMWPIVDFVTVHTPLIPATRGLINDAVFAKAKRGVRVVNVARGGIIDEEAIVRALDAGQCGGAALDVFSEEPPKDGSMVRRLVDHPGVMATPHLGASTTEAQLKVAQEIAESFVEAVMGKPLVGVVNAPELSNAMNPTTAPWVDLGTKLGTLLVKFLKKRPKILNLSLQGAAVKDYKAFLTSAVLLGCMREGGEGGEGVNLVSVRGAARETGVEVKVTVDGDAPGCVMSVEGEGVKVGGTVQGSAPLLTSINGTPVGFFELTGTVLIFKTSTLSVSEVVATTTDPQQVNRAGGCVLVRGALSSSPPAGTEVITLSF